MTGPHIDYAAVYRHLPAPVLLLTPEFVVVDVNQAYLRVTGRTRAQLLGRNVFDAFPENPWDPGATDVHRGRASMRRVLASGEPDALALQRYDVEVPDSPGRFAKRYWCPVNAPVFGPDGRVVLIAHCVEDVTDRISKFVDGLAADAAEYYGSA